MACRKNKLRDEDENVAAMVAAFELLLPLMPMHRKTNN